MTLPQLRNNGHSRFAPSASKRWIMCPGSIKLSEKFPPQPDTEYSREGTAAHDLAKVCLVEGVDAVTHKGKEFNGFIADDGMCEAVQVYLNEVWGRIPGDDPDTVFRVEQKVDLSWLHPGMYGSSDCYLFKRKQKVLDVLDYKHGVGIPVDADWNSQAMIYALGALHCLWAEEVQRAGKVISILQLVDTVEIVIVQPRWRVEDERIKVWSISARDLIYWGIHVLKGAAAACEEESAPLRAGDHCRFCPALAGCPAQAEHAMALAKTTFKDPVLPSPEDMTAEDISKVMRVAGMLKDWVDSVKEYAQHRMEMGMVIPGFKLVQKKANRSWADEAQAAQVLEGFLGERAWTKELLSVKQAEDALKKMFKDGPKKLEGLWVKPDTGLTMAAEDDRRAAVAPPASVAFLDDADFLK